MDVRYIDAHCHLQFPGYDADREEVIVEMRAQGVGGVVVGGNFESSEKAVELAERHKYLYVAVGFHPNHADEPFDFSAFCVLAEHSKTVAIGECGLDYFRPTQLDDAEKARQKELFEEQVALAIKLDKPLVIHSRPSKGTQDAYHDVLAILTEAKKSHSNLRGDIHFFVGGVPEAEAFLALDFTLSFTAVITFARDYDAVIRAVPLMSILAETDAPYVAPVSRRGKRNDPLAVIDVVQKIAEIRGEDLETVRVTLLENTRRLYSL